MLRAFLVIVVSWAITGVACAQTTETEQPVYKISAAQQQKLIDTYNQEQFLKDFLHPPQKVVCDFKHLISKPAEVSVTSLALSHDSSRVVVVYSDGQVIVFDPKTAQKVSALAAELQAPYTSVAISSKGEHILLGGPAGRGALVVRASDCQKVLVHEAITSAIKRVAISKDDKYAVAITATGEIHRYPLLGGEGNKTAAFAEDKECTLFCIANDASWAAVGIDATSGYQVQRMPHDEKWPEPIQMDPLRDPVQFIASNEYFMTVARDQLWVSKPPPGRYFVPSRTRGSSPRFSVVLPDERHLFLCDDTGHFEFRSLDAPGLYWWTQIPQVGVTAATMSADARTIVTGYKNGRTFILELPSAPHINGLEQMRQLHALLSAQRYHDLEALVATLERETTPLAWCPNASPIEALKSLMIDTPGLGYPDVMDRVEEWVRARPDADFPKLLLAEFYIAIAWQWRGSGVASTVTPEGWKGFQENIAKAEALVVPICEKQKPPPRAYGVMMTVAMAQGWPRERWQPYIDRLLEESPECIESHDAVMTYLMPRWHGAPGDCAKYAAEVADAIKGPAGDVMYARLLIGKARLYRTDSEMLADLQMDGERALKGLEHLSESESERAFALHWGMRLASGGVKDPVETKKFYDLLEKHQLGSEWEVGWWYDNNHVNYARRFRNDAVKTP